MNYENTQSELVESLEKLLQSANYDGALQLVINSIKHESATELVPELIRLTILTAEYNVGFKCMNNYIKFCDGKHQFAEEILLRFNIATNFKNNYFSNISIKPSPYEWVQSYYKDKSDPLYSPGIYACHVECSGASKYTFTLLCRCCGMRYSNPVYGTLLVMKEMYCPHCLSRQLLTFEMIRSFVQKNHNIMVSHKGISMDREVSKMSKKILQANLNQDLPEFASIYGQDTLFAIIQLLTDELLNE